MSVVLNVAVAATLPGVAEDAVGNHQHGIRGQPSTLARVVKPAPGVNVV